MKGKIVYTEKLEYSLDPRRLLGWYGGMGDRFFTTQEIELEDAREEKMDVDVNGFELGRLETMAKESYFDPLIVSKELFPAAEEMLEKRFPGSTCFVFDHIVRAEDKKNATLVSKPVSFAHNDYSVDSGKPRIQSLLEKSEGIDEQVLSEVMKERVAVVNVWMPLSPVKRDPLAFVDWKTTRPEDLIVVKLEYGGDEPRLGETTLAYPSPLHRWRYFSDMVPGEAILLKTWDRHTDQAARFAVHGAPQLVREDDGWFFSSSLSDRSPARESIELRCMVLFSPKAKELFKEGARFVAPHIKRINNNKDSKGFEKLVKKTLVDGDPRAF